MKFLLYVLSIFLISLHSVYIPSLGNLTLYSIIGSLLLIFISGKNFTKNPNSFFIIIILLFSSIIGIIDSKEIYISSIIAIFVGFTIYTLLINNKNKLLNESVIKTVLIIHYISIFIQILVFILFGKYLDLGYFLSGENSRTIGTGLLTGFYRFSGFHLEPANYALYTFGLTTLLQNFKKNNIYIILSSFTMCLSLSFSGILLSGILLTYLIKNLKNIYKISIILFLLILFISIPENFIDYLTLRADIKNDNSINIRLFEGFFLFEKLEVLEKIFGVGVGNYDLYYKTKISTVSSGLLFLLFHLGILNSLILIYFLLKNIYKRSKNYTLMLNIIIMLVTTISLVNPFFWFLASYKQYKK